MHVGLRCANPTYRLLVPEDPLPGREGRLALSTTTD
jgi:hypothetical protein